MEVNFKIIRAYVLLYSNGRVISNTKFVNHFLEETIYIF